MIGFASDVDMVETQQQKKSAEQEKLEAIAKRNETFGKPPEPIKVKERAEEEESLKDRAWQPRPIPSAPPFPGTAHAGLTSRAQRPPFQPPGAARPPPFHPTIELPMEEEVETFTYMRDPPHRFIGEDGYEYEMVPIEELGDDVIYEDELFAPPQPEFPPDLFAAPLGGPLRRPPPMRAPFIEPLMMGGPPLRPPFGPRGTAPFHARGGARPPLAARGRVPPFAAPRGRLGPRTPFPPAR